MIDAFSRLIQVIGSISNTTWGILILICSMVVAVKYNANIGYYFAGVGSTLAGISTVNSHTTGSSTTTIKD